MNDKTILEILKKDDNTKLLELNKVDLVNILINLKKYYLEYRSILSIDKNINFGLEIEGEMANYNKIKKCLTIVTDNHYMKDGPTLFNGCK